MRINLNRVKLVKPRQGWDSLSKTLWKAYAVGINQGFTDLGTYVDKPGDHGIGPPCFAFDLGRKDRFYNKGWNYYKARELAYFYVKHYKELNIEYVILGMKIWSRWGASQKKWDATYGWHPLTTGDTSHMFHIHVSGHHE